MSYEARAYDTDAGDPVIVLVVKGTHDVSRIINTLSGGPAVVEQLQTAKELLKQVRRHNAGRAALALLAAHGGPDFNTHDPAVPTNADTGKADS